MHNSSRIYIPEDLELLPDWCNVSCAPRCSTCDPWGRTYTCNLEYRHKKVTLRLQFWYRLLLGCWEPAFHMRWMHSSNRSRELPKQLMRQSEVLPALQGGAFLQLGWQVPKPLWESGISHLSESESGWCSMAGCSGLARLRCLWVCPEEWGTHRASLVEHRGCLDLDFRHWLGRSFGDCCCWPKQQC